MSPILFKNFIHTDKRDGAPFFLDLTYLDDYSTENSCANFQFSFPDNIETGRVNDRKYKFLIARVKNELFCYEIQGFTTEGWVNKNITIVETPKDFDKLHVVDGHITYLSKSGKVKKLKI